VCSEDAQTSMVPYGVQLPPPFNVSASGPPTLAEALTATNPPNFSGAFLSPALIALTTFAISETFLAMGITTGPVTFTTTSDAGAILTTSTTINFTDGTTNTTNYLSATVD